MKSPLEEVSSLGENVEYKRKLSRTWVELVVLLGDFSPKELLVLACVNLEFSRAVKRVWRCTAMRLGYTTRDMADEEIKYKLINTFFLQERLNKQLNELETYLEKNKYKTQWGCVSSNNGTLGWQDVVYRGPFVVSGGVEVSACCAAWPTLCHYWDLPSFAAALEPCFDPTAVCCSGACCGWHALVWLAPLTFSALITIACLGREKYAQRNHDAHLASSLPVKQYEQEIQAITHLMGKHGVFEQAVPKKGVFSSNREVLERMKMEDEIDNNSIQMQAYSINHARPPNERTPLIVRK